jgi:hypothetical protein
VRIRVTTLRKLYHLGLKERYKALLARARKEKDMREETADGGASDENFGAKFPLPIWILLVVVRFILVCSFFILIF